jgi:hypothetical protein
MSVDQTSSSTTPSQVTPTSIKIPSKKRIVWWLTLLLIPWLIWPAAAKLLIVFWDWILAEIYERIGIPQSALSNWGNSGQFGDTFGGLAVIFVVGAFLLTCIGVYLERQQLEASEKSRIEEQKSRMLSDEASRDLTEATRSLATMLIQSSIATQQSAGASTQLLKLVENERQESLKNANALRTAATDSSKQISDAMASARSALDGQLAMSANLNSAASTILKGYAEEEAKRLATLDQFSAILLAQRQAYEKMKELHDSQLEQVHVTQFFDRLRFVRDAIDSLNIDGKNGFEACELVWKRMQQLVETPASDRLQHQTAVQSPNQDAIQWRRTFLKAKLPAACVQMEPVDGLLEQLISLAEWIIRATPETNGSGPDISQSRRDEFGRLLAATVPDKLRSLLLYANLGKRVESARVYACDAVGLLPRSNGLAGIDFFEPIDRFVFIGKKNGS